MTDTAGDDFDRPVRTLVSLLREETDHPDAIARHVLRHTSGGIRLLGIEDARLRAVCFDPDRRCVYRLPVSAIGTHPSDVILDWRSVADPRSWIDAEGDSLRWTNPRYRNETDDSPRSWRYRVDAVPITPYI